MKNSTWLLVSLYLLFGNITFGNETQKTGDKFIDVILFGLEGGPYKYIHKEDAKKLVAMLDESQSLDPFGGFITPLFPELDQTLISVNKFIESNKRFHNAVQIVDAEERLGALKEAFLYNMNHLPTRGSLGG